MSRSSRTRALAVAVMALGTGAAVAALSPRPRCLLLIVIAAAIVVPIVRRVLEGRFDVLEPIFVFALAYGVMFLVRPLAIMASDDFVYRIAGQGVAIDETFDRMLTLSAVGAVSLVAGYEAPLGARLARSAGAARRQLAAGSLLGVTLAFAVCGAALFAAFAFVNGGLEGLSLVLSGRSAQLTQAVGESSKYLYFGPLLLIPAALTALAVGLRDRRPSLLVLAGAIAVLVVAMRGPVGSRMTLLPLFAGALAYYLSVRGKRPSVWAIVATLAIALAGSAFLLGIRDAAQRESASGTARLIEIVNRPAIVVDPLVHGQDAAEASALAAALTLVPDTLAHTDGGAMIGDLLARPLPRSVWPRKPVPPRELVIQRLWPRLYESGTANPEFSALLIPYLDGGLVGIAVVMLAYGVLMRAGYAYMRYHHDRMIVRLLYATCLPMVIVLLRDSLTDTLARTAFLVVPLLVAYQLAAVRDKGRRQTAASPGASDSLLPASRAC